LAALGVVFTLVETIKLNGFTKVSIGTPGAYKGTTIPVKFFAKADEKFAI